MLNETLCLLLFNFMQILKYKLLQITLFTEKNSLIKMPDEGNSSPNCQASSPPNR
jgi:hypothetical protein